MVRALSFLVVDGLTDVSLGEARGMDHRSDLAQGT